MTQDFSISTKSQVLSWVTKLDKNHIEAVSQYIILHSNIRDEVYDRFTQEKEKQIKQYNLKIQHHSVNLKNLVLLYQKFIKKLKSYWKDSFQVTSFENLHETSFILKQLNSRWIQNIFYKDYLKLFVLQKEYFRTETEFNIFV